MSQPKIFCFQISSFSWIAIESFSFSTILNLCLFMLVNAEPTNAVMNETTTIVTSHECFKFDLNNCSNSFDHQNEIECIWCEYWCLNKRKGNETYECKDFSNQLNKLFEKPHIRNVKPTKISRNVSTIITIHGNHFGISKSNAKVYNNITKIIFHDNTTCLLYKHTFSKIQCIIDEIQNHTGPMKMKLIYSRNVYDFQDTLLLEPANFHIQVVEDLNNNNNTKPHANQINHNDQNRYLIIFIASLLFLLLAASCWIVYDKRQSFQQQYGKIKLLFYLERTEKILMEKNLFIDYKSIEYQNKLGVGNFGEVYRATITNENGSQLHVAIKKLKKEINYSKTKMFITEGIKMTTFRHDRILTPLALSIDHHNRMPVIVLPLMLNGDLCRYLQQQRSFAIVNLLKFALQIAQGMQYLADKNFVHGDLAARNCLIDENFEIKIGDFGLSRELYKPDYFISNVPYRPIRWMALECLKMRQPKFTKKSDIWSYGVVLWEIFTLGSYPYEELDNADVAKFLDEGYRLSQPQSCPQVIYDIMLKCWSEDWTLRPSFESLSTDLEQIIASSNNIDDNHQQIESGNNPLLKKYCDYTGLADRFVIPSTKFSSYQSSSYIK